MIKSLLRFFSQSRWARRLHGGKWEEWYADPVNAWVWLDCEEWTPDGKRPGGCAIGHPNPAPRAREEYPQQNNPLVGGVAPSDEDRVQP